MDTRVVMEGNRAGKAGDSIFRKLQKEHNYSNTFQQSVLHLLLMQMTTEAVRTVKGSVMEAQ